MNCERCEKKCAKFGTTRDGQQRYRCCDCKRTYSEPKPLAGMHTPVKDACRVLSMLLEGVSIRSTSRLLGIDKNTIIRIMVQAGEQCQKFLPARVRRVEFPDIQVDEQWGFVYCKEKTNLMNCYGETTGDAYVYIAIDRDSKFIPCYHLGKRCKEDTWTFIEKLALRVGGRPQITSDGYKPYTTAIPLTYRFECDFAQLSKKYGMLEPEGPRRYSPASIIGTDRKAVCGQPNDERISTSHIERMNLSNRMCNRRMTRLTNGFSKKWENHEAMLALWFCYYNGCRKHMTIKTTPAIAAGLATEQWSVERLLLESAAV